VFISFEGIDNVGKTTICKILKRRLSKSFRVHVISDPPKIPPWASLRDRILSDKRITSTALAVVLLGMRIDSFNRSVSPRLAKAELLLADRFVDSWFAYQLPKTTKHFKSTHKARKFLESLNTVCLNCNLLVVPDKTYLILGDVSETIKRGEEKARSVYDSMRTQRQVQRTYLKLAKASNGRIELIDSKNLSIAQIAGILEAKIRSLMTLGTKSTPSIEPRGMVRRTTRPTPVRGSSIGSTLV